MKNTIRIQENISIAEWESFLQKQPLAQFLQSAHMVSLHTTLSDRVWLLGVYDQEELVGVCFVTLITARRGWHLYIPYGPVLSQSHMDVLPELMTYVKNLGQEVKADFIRCSPFLPDIQDVRDQFVALGFRPAPIHVLAEHIWLLDLAPTQEELLKGMRKTMRNLIKRAEKDGVEITTSEDPKDIELFIAVHQDTASRHGFTPYTPAYFRAQAESFLPEHLGKLYFAHYQGTIISSAFIMHYGDSASYHHGASLSAFQKIPASYLLQWRAICDAKERGLSLYNFWGIVPEQHRYSRILKRPHPWIGLSSFKTGFGGYQYDLLHCQDMPLTFRYRLTACIETLRRFKRGY